MILSHLDDAIRKKAPVVKWISLLTSDQSLGVRVPPGAQTQKDPPCADLFVFVCVGTRKGCRNFE